MTAQTRTECNFHSIRLYQRYEPSQSHNPRIKVVEEKVESLMQKLQAEQARWFITNHEKIENLKNDLDLLVAQRDELIEIDALNKRTDKLLNSLPHLNHQKNKIECDFENESKGAGYGFAAAAVLGRTLGLGNGSLILVLGIGTVAGAILKKFRSE